MARTTKWGWATVAAGLFSAAVGLGCPFGFTNGDHCAANGGDVTCRAADPGRPYCALDGCGLYDEVDNRTGCVAVQPEQASCYSPCGEDGGAGSGDGCGIETEGTTGPSSTDPSATPGTQPSASTASSSGPMGCDCGPEAPLCIDDQCVACDSNAVCEEQFGEERRLCNEESGDCVRCMSVLDTTNNSAHLGCSQFGDPNCGPEMCQPACQFPDDCEVGACTFNDDGLCGVVDRVFYVAPDGDDGAQGTADDPFETVQRAVNAVGLQNQGGQPPSIGTVMLAEGTYVEAVTVIGRTVLLRAQDPDADRPILRAPDPEEKNGEALPAILLQSSNGAGAGFMSMVGVDIRDSPGLAVQVESSARFYGDDVRFVGNGKGIEIQESGGFLRNSVVARTATTPFILIGGEFAIVASTIVDNDTDGGDRMVFACSQPARLSVHDSIVSNYDEDRLADMVTPDECMFDDGAALRTVQGAEVNVGHFRDLDDYLLDASPDPAFEFGEGEEAVVFCAPGERIQDSGFLKPCPPRRDIDGQSRVDNTNYKGASLP